MSDLFSLKGKTAIVTGASTGLGQAMCIALSQAGAFVAGIDYVDMNETKEKITSLGGIFLDIVSDLTTTEPIQPIIDQTISSLGRLDILINNAGIVRRQDAIDFSEKNWDDVLGINLKTVFFFSQAAAKQFMKQKSGGKIINVASMISFHGGLRVPSYAAAKSGVAGITKSMANEWAKFNINVNAIAPGFMVTNNTADLRQNDENTAFITKRIPAGRWGYPKDVMGPIVFLASNASDYVNGHILAIDGGYLGR